MNKGDIVRITGEGKATIQRYTSGGRVVVIYSDEPEQEYLVSKSDLRAVPVVASEDEAQAEAVEA